MDQKIIVGNVCFIIDETKQKILLLKRNKNPMIGMYSGVGGKTAFCEDINESCLREIKEETGLTVTSIELKGVIKTILEEKSSSWILFVYTANQFSGNLIKCSEGDLSWVDMGDIYNKNLIGFIRALMPRILRDKGLFEATIKHDICGNVLEENNTL